MTASIVAKHNISEHTALCRQKHPLGWASHFSLEQVKDHVKQCVVCQFSGHDIDHAGWYLYNRWTEDRTGWKKFMNQQTMEAHHSQCAECRDETEDKAGWHQVDLLLGGGQQNQEDVFAYPSEETVNSAIDHVDDNCTYCLRSDHSSERLKRTISRLLEQTTNQLFQEIAESQSPTSLPTSRWLRTCVMQ